MDSSTGPVLHRWPVGERPCKACHMPIWKCVNGFSCGLLFLFTSSIARSAKRQYISYSEGDFDVFCPTGATRCGAINLKIALGVTYMPSRMLSKTTWVSWHQNGYPFWILLDQEMMGWQWLQLDHMQIVCTLLQTDHHASTPPLCFL